MLRVVSGLLLCAALAFVGSSAACAAQGVGRLLIAEVALPSEAEDASLGPTLTAKLRKAASDAGYTLTGDDPAAISIAASYGTVGAISVMTCRFLRISDEAVLSTSTLQFDSPSSHTD